jgi:hypothetical protein
MPADRAEDESGENSPRKGRRLMLMESYDAFSDERLQEVTEKIRGITSRQVDQPPLPHDDAAHPLGGRIGESIDELIGESIGTPIRPLIDSPIGSPYRSPDNSPFESPIGSPIESPDDHRAHDAVLLTESQAILYFCLQRIGGVTTRLSRIARETGISEHTLSSTFALFEVGKSGISW